MGKYEWTVARRGENPKVIKRFNWSSKLIHFILRNPAMFKGRQLTIKNHGQIILHTTFSELQAINNMGMKEGETRKFLIKKGREQTEIHARQ